MRGVMAEDSEKSGACLRFENELEAYLEGDLQPFISAHARECGACEGLLSDLEMIRQTAAAIPLEEPSAVVWANVRAQLEAEGAFQKSRGWHRFFSGISLPHPVPVGVLASLMILGSALTLAPAGRWKFGGSAPAFFAALATVQPSVAEDGSMEQVVGELETNYRANERSLAPDLKATYEKSLGSLNGSIRECRASLRQEPGNALAHEYLVSAYTRKAELLSSALEFEGDNGR